MRILVFGANGRVGSLVVAEAARRGHQVRAFVYATSEHIPQHDNIEIVRGDACAADDVERAMTSVNVVINCLGSWGTKTKDIQTRAMRVIIPAMSKHDVKRIVSITGAEAWAASDRITITNKLSHTLFGVLAGKILADGEDHLHQLESSGLDWTVVRSPAMTDKGTGDNYAFTTSRPSLVATIRRDSVAQAMVDLAESDQQIGRSPFLTRK
jgi:putative NADH-flavin reductase